MQITLKRNEMSRLNNFNLEPGDTITEVSNNDECDVFANVLAYYKIDDNKDLVLIKDMEFWNREFTEEELAVRSKPTLTQSLEYIMRDSDIDVPFRYARDYYDCARDSFEWFSVDSSSPLFRDYNGCAKSDYIKEFETILPYIPVKEYKYYEGPEIQAKMIEFDHGTEYSSFLQIMYVAEDDVRITYMSPPNMREFKNFKNIKDTLDYIVENNFRIEME